MFAVLVNWNWITNVPAEEALVYKQEGYTVIRMDQFLCEKE